MSLGLLACGSGADPGDHVTGGSGGAHPGTGGSGGAQPDTGGVVGECKGELQLLAVESAPGARVSGESAPGATVSGAPDQTAVLALTRAAGAADVGIVLYQDLASLVPGGQPKSRRFTASS
jgi:hypothetical protein